MASRSSIYSSALKVPEWVFGGDYGDLSNTLNNRDMNYEKVQAQEIQNDINDIKLEEDQRDIKMRDAINADLGATRPGSIREAYQRMADAAYQAGDPMAALEYEAKGEQYAQAQLNKKRQELNNAISIADNVGLDRVEELYPGVLSPNDYARNQKRLRAATEKTFPMYNVETKKLDPSVPYSEAMQRQDSGKWIFTKDPSFDDGGLSISGAPTAAPQGLGGVLGNAYRALLGGSAGEDPSQKQKDVVEQLKDAAPGKGAEKASDSRPIQSEKVITATNPKTGQKMTWNAAKKVWE